MSSLVNKRQTLSGDKQLKCVVLMPLCRRGVICVVDTIAYTFGFILFYGNRQREIRYGIAHVAI